MSAIFLLVTEYEFVPNYNLALTGILMLECEVMTTSSALRCQFSMYSKSVANSTVQQ
jgi:hypothetical protein